MLNKFLKLFGNSTPSSNQQEPAEAKQLDASLISSAALKVIAKLQSAGYSAYLVGGGIRDILLRGKPKDFDVATNATPEQVKAVFRNAMIIGRRFRIVHVRFGREIIEVTTFRAHHDSAKNKRDAEQSQSGMLLRDNVYGDIESDAARRDFTVNALYYDPSNDELLDFTQGLDDIKQRTLRMIGDPEQRYKEDPVRMLRAARFSAKLGFAMEPATEAAIEHNAHLLQDIPPARLFEEVLKLMCGGSATATFELLCNQDLFKYLFPLTAHCLHDARPAELAFISNVLVNTDKRLRQNKRVTPAFIYAAFLWLPLIREAERLMETGNVPKQQAMQQAANAVIGQQLSATSIPKRFLMPMRDIWFLQLRLPRRDGGKAFALLDHPRFRAAYDFLLLREDAGEDLEGLGQWWTNFQSANEAEREQMVQSLGKSAPHKRKPRRRRRKPSAKNSGGNSDQATSTQASGPSDEQ